MPRENAAMRENRNGSASLEHGIRVLRAEELETVSGGHRSPSEFVLVHHNDKASLVLM
jgi:hypothetical protein